jgi:hypothetical protein
MKHTNKLWRPPRRAGTLTRRRLRHFRQRVRAPYLGVDMIPAVNKHDDIPADFFH